MDRMAIRHRIVLELSMLALLGCAPAPSQNVFGSYFPSWMLCALGGLFAAALVRRGLVLARIWLPAPAVVDLVMAVAFAFGGWLLWLD